VIVRNVTYDPAELGILNCVTIGLGPTYSVLWIAACIPYKGGNLDGGGLEAKLRQWYLKNRAPTLDRGDKKEASKNFDAIRWIWGHLLPNRIASSELNWAHVGVIFSGDLNQKLKQWDETSSSLQVRAEGISLYTYLEERFQYLDQAYLTYQNQKRWIYMIDNVFSLLPDHSL
jgi:hypothetical protein